MPALSRVGRPTSATFSVASLAILVAAACGIPSARAQTAAVNGSGQTQDLDCAGGDALVNGSSNRVSVHGECHSLRVNGSDNVIEIELTAGAPVAIAGNSNHVLYAATGGGVGPSVSTQGTGNQIDANDQPQTATLGGTLPTSSPKPPTLLLAPAGPTTGAVVLDGSGQTQTADCNGRDVLIHGSSSQFTLTGGCRSISVQGRADHIQAQLQPGARVAIGGNSVTLSYTLTGPGPAPMVSVTGTNSAATHVENFGDSSVTVPAGTPVVMGQPGAAIGAPAH